MEPNENYVDALAVQVLCEMNAAKKNTFKPKVMIDLEVEEFYKKEEKEIEEVEGER